MFAQSCEYMYTKYNDVFDYVDFSATHWKEEATSESDIAKKKRDLDKLANKLAEKLGLAHITLEYLRDKDNNILGYFTDKNGNKFIIGGTYKSESNQILINKIYLKEASAEEMIKVVAEEVYHACQYNEILKLQNQYYKKQYDELLYKQGSAENEIKRALIGIQINNLKEKIEIIKEWEKNSRSKIYEEIREYNQAMINNPNLANNLKFIELQTRKKIDSLNN